VEGRNGSCGEHPEAPAPAEDLEIHDQNCIVLAGYSNCAKEDYYSALYSPCPEQNAENRAYVEALFADRKCWQLATPIRLMICMLRNEQIRHRVRKGLAFDKAVQELLHENAYFDFRLFLFSGTAQENCAKEVIDVVVAKMSWNLDFSKNVLDIIDTKEFSLARATNCTAAKLDEMCFLPHPITCDAHEVHVRMMGQIVSVLAAIRVIRGEPCVYHAFQLVMHCGGMQGSHFFG